MMDNVTFEEASHDRCFTTYIFEGLSVEEIDQILANHDALGDVMEKHGMGNTYNCWHNGYGIYGIRHFGGHLLVMIGNSCD
jgi:hypothetical protein